MKVGTVTEWFHSLGVNDGGIRWHLFICLELVHDVITMSSKQSVQKWLKVYVNCQWHVSIAVPQQLCSTIN